MNESGEREPLLTNQNGHGNDAFRRRSSSNSELLRHRRILDRDPHFRIDQLTLLEKVLAIVCATLLILVCVFVGLYADSLSDSDDTTLLPSPTDVPGNPVCLSAECVLTASEILEDIDTTVDPCEDFFEYSCGNWLKTHDIPEGKSITGKSYMLATRNKEVLHRILMQDFDSIYQQFPNDSLSNSDKELDRQNFNKVKSLFDSCMDEAAIDSVGAEPLLSLLRDIQRLYPETHDIVDDRGQLTRTLAHLFKNGVDALFHLNIDPESKDPDTMAIQIFQSGLTLPSKEYYTQSEMVDTLYDVIRETMDLIFSKLPDVDWTKDIAISTVQLIVEFEKKLANISDPREYFEDTANLYHPTTASQLEELSPNVDWKLLQTLLLSDAAPFQDVVILTSPRYIQELSAQVLGNSTRHTIQAYLLWRAIDEYASALGEEIREPLKRLAAKLGGTSPQMAIPRWEVCLDQIEDALGFMAGRYFVLQTFSEKTKTHADEFVDSIKDSFVSRLSELAWIDETTRQGAMEKVELLLREIGYPTKRPNVMSPESLANYYSDLVIDRHDYFGNYMRSRQWLVLRDWQQLGKPSDKYKWLMSPQVVNAYSTPYNGMVFPAGIMQPPYFSGDFPDYLNYGGIGAVVGHELTHQFDNDGRHYDGKGRLREWWTEDTLRAFEERTKCFLDQYGNFTMEDADGNLIHVNGQLTLGENVADNGGVRQSYTAWKKRYDQHKHRNSNMLLPGFENATPEQLFFINYGRIWCRKATKARAKQNILTDEHSPPKWRVIGALQNSKYFAEAFNCPAGSRMNPEKKCEIW